MSNKKLHYKFGVQLDCVDDFSQLKLLANQHHAVLIDNINFRSAAEFEQWTSLFASIDTTNNQSLDYQGMGLRNNNILTPQYLEHGTKIVLTGLEIQIVLPSYALTCCPKLVVTQYLLVLALHGTISVIVFKIF
jgi:hypothetical protein